jgi:hypothetical protein
MQAMHVKGSARETAVPARSEIESADCNSLMKKLTVKGGAREELRNARRGERRDEIAGEENEEPTLLATLSCREIG